MQRKWYVSVVQVSTVRAVVLALMSSLLTAVVAVTTPAPAQAIGAQGVMLDTSVYHHSCAIDSNGEVWCWGYNTSTGIQLGMLGAGLTTESSTVPVKANLPNGVIARQLVMGYVSACVISTTGQLYCWGNFTFGNGPFNMSETPTLQSVPNNSEVLDVALGRRSHVCMLLETNTVCGGDNAFGQLGTPDTSTNYRQVPLPAATVDLDVEWDSSCAVLATGQVYCWGSNQYGQLGNPALTDTMTSTPQLVSLPAGAVATSVSVGISSTCVVLSTGPAYCWGKNDYGQLGTGNYTNSTSPQLLQMPSGESVTSIHAGNSHACAITVSEQLYCWGWNGYGQLGLDQLVNRNVPTLVSVPLNAGEKLVEVGVGTGETCVMTTSRTLCSGLNHKGQLGNGTTTDATTFQEVSGFTETSRRCADVTSTTGQNYELWDLSYCDFAKVPGATFESATAYGVNLQYAKAAGLNFRNALLGNAFFENSDLVSADFRRASIGGVRFNNANLTSAMLDTATASSTNFLGANLSSISVNATNFSGAQVDRGAGPGIVGTPAAMPSERTLVSGTFRSTDVLYWALRVGSGTADTPTITTNAGGIGVLIADPVANSVDSVTVTVTKSNPGQKIFFNGVESASGIKSETLTVGDNAIQIRILADDGTSERITSLIVPRQADCSAALAPGVNLFGCDLRSRNLAGVNLTNANLGRATLSGMNLETLTAPGANLGHANLSGANLHQVSFLNAMLLGANFESATLTQAGMAGVLAENANFTNANLSQANLTNAFLQSAVLTNATLTSAVLNNALVTNANFSGAVVSVGAGPVSGSAIFAMSDYLRIVSGRFRSGALMSLSVNATMTPAFAVDTRDYYVSLPNTTTALQFTVTPADSATVLKLEFNLMTGSPNAPFSAVETVAVPVGTTTFRVDNMVEGSGGGVILTNRWNIHVTRAAAPAPSSGSGGGGGGGGGGAPAPAPIVTTETATTTPKVETSTVTPKVETATATGGSGIGGSTSTGSGSVNETPTVTAPLVTTEVRRLVFTYTPRQTVLNKAQLQRLRSQLTATTTAVSVLGYVTRSKSTSADRALSLQRANRAASQIVRTSSTPKPTTRGAGGAKAKGCETAKNNCVVVLITRTK